MKGRTLVLIIIVALGVGLSLVGTYAYEAQICGVAFLVGYFLGKAYPNNEIL
ncbi:hypothetical protein OAF30_05120 [Flavobacteriales bacterium]|nr:hypothetical protein [Flavobacteriales bacterium]